MKVTYSEQPPLFMRVVCWLSLRSPDDILAHYNRATHTVWIRSTLSAETKEYALQHEIGHSKHMDWKGLVMYMATCALPFVVAWAILRILGLPLWATRALLLGVLSMPIRWRYLEPWFKRKSEDFAHEYATAQMKES